MNIAVGFIGLCRPKLKDCIENIDLLKKCFTIYSSSPLYNYDSFLFDDNNEIGRELAKEVDIAVLTNHESDEQILGQFPNVQCRNCASGWCKQVNIWRLRKKIVNFYNFIINSKTKYDFIVYSRPCTTVEIDVLKYLNKDFYNPIYSDGSIVDDRFGVATPEIFEKVWNLTNEELSEFNQVNNDEEFLRLTCNKKEIQTSSCGAKKFILRKDK